MKRLGYTRYAAQGGDWGAIVVQQMATLGHPELIGIHTNMAGVIPPEINAAAFGGAPTPSGLSAEERQAYEALAFFYKNVSYALYMGNRPQTMVGLADSPVALAAFMIDHDARSLELIARSFDGQREGLSRDDVLDNITHFWLTNSGISAARLYWENKLAFFSPMNITIPVAVSVFPDELYPAPRSWTERAFPNLIHYNRVEKGGHFAAWEQPKIFTNELRAAFKSLRSAQATALNAEKRAWALIRAALEHFGIDLATLRRARKGDWRKGLIAAMIQKETTMRLDWITQELKMGTRAGVCRLAAEARKRLATDGALRRKVEAISKTAILNG
jgi:pimeloyl-ACP methyl ester carboxylesterase